MTAETVKLRDVLRVGTCRPRIRAKLDVLGLSFDELAGPGIPISVLEGVDDVHVQRSVAFAKSRIEAEMKDQPDG